MTLCYVLHQTHSEFGHFQNSDFSGIFRHIQAYSAFLDIIKTYSGLFRDAHNPEYPSHIRNLAIFRALAYLEMEACSKPCETLTRSIHNPAIVRTVFSGIIQPYSKPFVTLAYAEAWHIQNHGRFGTLP